jgi:ribose transport system substrate-binding protein
VKSTRNLRRARLSSLLALGWLVSATADRAFAADVVTPGDADKEKVMSEAPPGARQYYDGYWFSPPIIADPLTNWQPHKPPWQFCHNESYLGNSWRAALLDEVKKGVTQLAKQGLAKPDVMVTNSNGDINVELTQLRSQIAQGCDVIISFPGSATGLCSAIEEAADKGILFIAIDSQVSCRAALNVAQNPYYYGKYEGDWIAKEMGGKGNIVIINGQPGVSVTIAKRQGMLDAMKPYSNIKVSGDLYGMWTPAVAKSEMLKYLATHPEPVDAVWSSGQMSVAGGEALEQAGRPLPKIVADGTNMCSYMAYWKNHDLDGFTLAGGGAPMAFGALQVAIRAMAGQKPKVNTIYMPIPVITNANFKDYYKPGMTVQDTCWADPPDGRLVPDDYFDQFFTGGQPQPKILP